VRAICIFFCGLFFAFDCLGAISHPEIFDRKSAAPELYFFPRETLRAVRTSSFSSSPTRQELDHFLSESRQVFGSSYLMLVTLGVIHRRWSSELQKEIPIDWKNFSKELMDPSHQLNAEEKTLLISAYALMQLHQLRESTESAERILRREFFNYIEAKDSRSHDLLEVDPIYRADALSDAPLPAKSWSADELRQLRDAAGENRGEIIEESAIETILKSTSSYRRARLERKGRIPNFIEEDSDGRKKITPPVIVGGVSLGLLGALFSLRSKEKKENVRVNVWLARPWDDLEEALYQSRPPEWRTPESEEWVRETISLLIRNPWMKIRSDEGNETQIVPQEFQDLLWQARMQHVRIEKFMNQFLAHGASPKQIDEARNAIGFVLEMNRARMRELNSIVDAQLRDIARGGISKRGAVELIRRGFALRRNMAEDEKKRADQYRKNIRLIPEILPFSDRQDFLNQMPDKFRMSALVTPILSRWWHPLRERQTLENLTSAAWAWRGFWNFNRRFMPDTFPKSAAFGASVGETAVRCSCKNILRRAAMNLGWTVGFAGLGYSAKELLKNPEEKLHAAGGPEADQLQISMSNLSAALMPLYLSNFKLQWELWGARSGFDVYFSAMTEPLEETGVDSQIYILIAPKSTEKNVAEIRQVASEGALLQFHIRGVGINAALAEKLGMRVEYVPQKLEWQFEKMAILTGNNLSQKVLGIFDSENHLTLVLDMAKEAMTLSQRDPPSR
jgi:hypothetical protein